MSYTLQGHVLNGAAHGPQMAYVAGNALSSSVACEVLLGAYTEADATVSNGEKADDLQDVAALPRA